MDLFSSSAHKLTSPAYTAYEFTFSYRLGSFLLVCTPSHIACLYTAYEFIISYRLGSFLLVCTQTHVASIYGVWVHNFLPPLIFFPRLHTISRRPHIRRMSSSFHTALDLFSSSAHKLTSHAYTEYEFIISYRLGSFLLVCTPYLTSPAYTTYEFIISYRLGSFLLVCTQTHVARIYGVCLVLIEAR